MINWTLCIHGDIGGNLISWSQIDDYRNQTNILLKTMNLQAFCRASSPGVKFLPNKRTFHQSIEACRKFRSEIYTFNDSVANTYTFDINIPGDDPIWSGYTDFKVEGEFRALSGDWFVTSSRLIWRWGEPNGNESENCAVIPGVYSNQLNDYPCNSDAITACNIKEVPKFHFQGHQFEEEAFIMNMAEHLTRDQYYFQGYYGTTITSEYEPEENKYEWTFVNGEYKYKTCTPDLPIGTWDWKYDDDKNIRINLNACNNSEFSCRDGECISKWKRCNHILFECEDKSDEADCKHIELKTGYNKVVPPNAANEEITILNMTIWIKHVLNMDINNMKLSLLFEIKTEWQDNRVYFLNVHRNWSSNLLELEEWQNIWVPNFLFLNAETTLTSAEQAGEPTSLMYLKLLNETHQPKDSSKLVQDFYYDGMDVVISKDNFYTMDFLCLFDFAYYPFDCQTCSIRITPQTSRPDLIDFNVNTSLLFSTYSTYTITLESTLIGYDSNHRAKTVEVSLKFKRNVVPIVLNTYLPTVILTIINQLTNHFIGQEMFEAIISINASVLMTIASLFIATFNTLPNTVYIKMIDIWMIVTFVYPFIIILLHTCIHVIRKSNQVLDLFNGTVRDPPCKNGNARFTTVPLIVMSNQVYELDIHVFVYLNCLFTFVVSLKK